MFSKTTTFFFIIFIVFMAMNVESTYRKPPFNGSIFGKRGAAVEYEATKALSAMCEIASEACQAWFPIQEKK
ncbi:neuropeptide SIFamide [Harmonia axyridis]|uniref:neuropeptide SIFamide n=1 Tax=Harmonia axyridis TaxID=115357 RepID=UPI001E277050|nr:neuropeptide SIFamide [Harmonia axyridis]